VPGGYAVGVEAACDLGEAHAVRVLDTDASDDLGRDRGLAAATRSLRMFGSALPS
jgi:hypothetical protein